MNLFFFQKYDITIRFTPFGDPQMSAVYFLIYFLVYLEEGGKFTFLFTWKRAGNLNLKFGFEVFFKKMFRYPLLLDGGVRGFLFLRGQYRYKEVFSSVSTGFE